MGERTARVRMANGRVALVRVDENTTPEQIVAIANRVAPKEGKGFFRKLDDIVRGVADSVTMGTADEISAGLSTATGIGGKFGDYSANIKAQRDRDATGGYERLAGQVLGGLVLPIPKIAAAKGLKGLFGAAATGLGYGAAYGAGSAEGGLADRAKAMAPGAAIGAAGGVAGRVVGNVATQALRGKQVSPAIRKLADEGVVMTPGQRGGAVRKTFEEGVLGSIPFVKSVPQAAKRRGVEQFNVAAYNRVLKPIGGKMPMGTQPGREAVAALQDTVYSAYDDAASRLVLGADGGLLAGKQAIARTADANVGQNAGQLNAIIDRTLAPLANGPASGTRVRDILQDLRGEASQFARSPVANERRIGDELWKMHDHIEAALVRQNDAGVLEPFKAARSAVSNLKRVEAAAASAKADGVFNPQQFSTAVSKRGYGTTTSNVARGQAPMQDLADAAKQVLPATIPNSGTPERALGASLSLGGPGAIGAFVDPTMGVLTAAPLVSYMPGLDRLLQNLALQRPDLFTRAGNAVERASPALGMAGTAGSLGYFR